MCHFYRIIYNSGINKSILLSENSSLNFLRLLPDVLASDLTSIENRSSAIEKIQSALLLFLLSANLAEVIEIIHDFPNAPDQCIECARLIQIDQDHTDRDCKDHPHNTAHPVTDEHE